MSFFGALTFVLVAYLQIEGFTSSQGRKNQSDFKKEIIYTKHAHCRMGCRYLDKKEVLQVISQGKVNKRKSNFQGKPCPVLAKEGETQGAQRARVVYADCKDKIKVITVIDLDTDHHCSCK